MIPTGEGKKEEEGDEEGNEDRKRSGRDGGMGRGVIQVQGGDREGMAYMSISVVMHAV